MLTDHEMIQQALAQTPNPDTAFLPTCEVLLRYPFLIRLKEPVTLYTEWKFTFVRQEQTGGQWAWQPACIKVHDQGAVEDPIPAA